MLGTTTPGTTNTASTTPLTTNTAHTTTSNEKCPFTVFKGKKENLIELGPYDECCEDMSCVNDNYFCNKWSFQDDGKQVTQENNNEPATILIDDEAVQGVDFNGTMKVAMNSDSDWIGVTFGYQDSNDFLVLLAPGSKSLNHKDHWRLTKVLSTSGVSSQEMSDAITNSEESVPNQTEVLWIDSNDDNGWTFDVEYLWQVQYRPIQGLVTVKVFEGTLDNQIIDIQNIAIQPTESYHKFGIFARSQPKVTWHDMKYECNDL